MSRPTGTPDRSPAKRSVRCPKCQSVELTLRESVVCFSGFQQHADGTIDTDGYHSEGAYFRVDATCNGDNGCGHGWRVRGARQITDIRDDSAPAPAPAEPQPKEEG